MKKEEIYRYVDHTLLKPYASKDEIDKLCKEARDYKMASVCVPPSYVSYIREKDKDINITTVIGFPLGYSTTEIKVKEAENAIKNGANEIDMVINLTYIKNKEFNKLISEINDIKKVVGNNILKVIIETCYLTEEEKVIICKSLNETKADYIKTSTGFGTSGANFKDIKLFTEYIDDRIKIKAAGGIRTKEDMVKYIELGCDRLGTSSAIKILE